MKNFTIKDLALNAILGAAYVVLVLVFNFFSFEVVQFRIAEVLLVLLLFNFKLSPGIMIGTAVANIAFSPFGILDGLIGTIASLLAILFMYIFKKLPIIALLMPVIFNGLIVGLFIHFISEVPLLFAMGSVALGELVVMYALGIPIYYMIKNNETLLNLINEEL